MKTVNVMVQKRIALEKYYVIRGIHVGKNGVKTVIEEKEVNIDPYSPFSSDGTEEIAQMLIDNPEITFCTIAENYRLPADATEELPFT